MRTTTHCGYCGPRTTMVTSGTCPECRDVPEGDINSPLTNWVYTDKRCLKDHQAFGNCKQRQLRRTVARLASIFNSLTLTGVVEGYADCPAGLQGCTSYPIQVLYIKSQRTTAAQEVPIARNLPLEVQKQAASVENCVAAICWLTPALAWLTKGLSLRLRELNVAPKPVKQTVIWNTDRRTLHTPATIHTVLVVSEGPDSRREWNTSEPWWEEVGEAGWVLDATFSQYGFETAIQPLADYLWTKVQAGDEDGRTTSSCNFVRGFGNRFRKHQNDLEYGQGEHRITPLLHQLCMKAMNNTLHDVIVRLGGRAKVLHSRHQQFCRDQQQIELAVSSAVRHARDLADRVWCQPQLDLVSELQKLVDVGWDLGHGAMMDDLRNMRSG